MSRKVLQFFSEQENYERYAQYVAPHTVSAECNVILKSLKSWYESHGDVDWLEFSEWWCLSQAGSMKQEKMETYKTLFRVMSECDEELEDDIVNQFIAQDYCTQIAELTLKGAEGDKIDVASVEQLVNAWNSTTDNATKLDQYIVTEALDEIIDYINLGGFMWAQDDLNKAVGNIRQGKLICFAARPNVGKTTFLASNVCHVAQQIDDGKKILWFNNEEDGKEVKYRLAQAGLQLTNEEIEADRATAKQKYQELYEDKIVVIDKANANTKDVEEYIRQYPPAMIIFDQLWKVHGFEGKNGNDTARLHQMFLWARELAKLHAPVMTVHQVKTEGEGQQWLTPDLLYLSGTAIQGEVDTLIMMGRSYSQEKMLDRYVTIAKNKGAYGPMVDSSLREARFEWTINPERATFN